MTTATTTIEIKRGIYNEIISMPADVKTLCNQLMEGVRHAAKVDEHGGWEFGLIDSNYKKGMVHAINYDWYGVGYDQHDGGFLAVVQVREFYRRKASRFAEIRKSYFLLGTNEDGTYFAHSVESRVIHHAAKKGMDVVKAVQDWIFDCDYSRVIRQGDLCLIPVRSVKGEKLETTDVVLEQSHSLHADAIYENGSYYAINPNLVHIPGTHPQRKLEGKYKIVVGKRAAFWSFAKPTLD